MSNKSLIRGTLRYKVGSSQEERQLEALKVFPPIDGRTRKEVYQFLQDFAKEISYYSLKNEKAGTWSQDEQGTARDFLPELLPTSGQEATPFEEIATYWQALGLSKETLQRPHLSLILVFIELFELLKEQLNQLSQKHLDYYYKRVLQIDRRTYQPDQVYVQFKIKEALNDYFLPKATRLSAGVDALGNPLVYALDEEISLNQAEIKEIHTLLVDHTGGGLVYASTIQSTAVEDPPISENDALFWPPFGEPQYNKDDVEKTMVLADLGWCIATPLLYLQEGTRQISVLMDLGPHLLSCIEGYDDLSGHFEAFFSGAVAWIPAATTTAAIVNAEDEHADPKLQLTLTLEATQPAVVAYNEGLDAYPLTTDQPCLKVLLKQTSDENIYTKLKNLPLNGIALEVEVSELTQVDLFNDSWNINRDQPFHPFETYPLLGSHFYIGCKELFQKAIETVRLKMNWQQVPENMGDHYKGYYGVLVLPAQTKVREVVSLLQGEASTIQEETLEQDGPTLAESLENAAIALAALDLSTASSALEAAYSITTQAESLASPAFSNAVSAAKTAVDGLTISWISNEDFQAEIHLLDHGNWTPTQDGPIPLFDSTSARITHTVGFDFPSMTGLTSEEKKDLDTSNFSLSSRNGFVRLTLSGPEINQASQPFSAFGYEEYPQMFSTLTENNNEILSERIIAENKQAVAEAQGVDIPPIGPEIPPMLLPKEPYEPTINQFSLEYTAKETLPLNANSVSESQCFQLSPFGHKEVFQQEPLLAQYMLNDGEDSNGNLYIGFENLAMGQSVSLLVTMTQGYVNTINTSENRVVEWCYLKDDRWIPFAEKHLLNDGTDGFTQSGLLVIALPDEATDGAHRLMPPGLKWVQIKTDKETDQIEKMMGLSTQVGVATFVNQENDLHHLSTSLPAGSIEGLVEEDSNIDQVIQAYPSFGGQGTEGDDHYYTRVSERLRHKNRAITTWDYEQLVLEGFPNIHRVKCLRSTNQQGEAAPGYLTLVVIPRTINYQLGNRYRPKASQKELLSMQEYLASKASPYTHIALANPFYEILEVHCEVAFTDQLRVGQYKKQLNEDLKRLLSPWAYEDENSITFSDVLYRSQILLYVENRPYVDYVSQLSITHLGKEVSSEGIGQMRIVAIPTDASDFRIAGSYSSIDQSIIQVQSQGSIFVTADEHFITEHTIVVPPVILEGINYWILETEFTVF